jgi:hypothetical protein
MGYFYHFRGDKLQRNFCFCATTKLGIRLTPISDVVEFVFYLIFSLVIFLNQDTWLVQFSIMIFANALSCIVKLGGSFALLMAEAPDPKTFEVSVCSYNCYFFSRMACLTINIMGFIA